jgi:restriction system protein
MMPNNFVGREEELEQIRKGFEAGKRFGIIEGQAGVGKTALAQAFAKQASIKFPGGINFIRAFDNDHIREALKSIRPSSLSIFDDAEMLNPSILKEIQRIGETTRNFNALFTTRLAPQFEAIRKSQEAFQLQLGTLSRIDFSKFAKQFEIPSELQQTIAKLTAMNPLVLEMAGSLVASQEYEWAQIAKALRDFEIPGIVDPEGNPVDVGSSEGTSLITDIREINDELLTLLQKDPSSMREMRPRDFEKLIAELLGRAGYETELTPASNDGGVDIYAARNDGLGRFLYLVECKRYGEDNPVGVQIVRSLYGVVQQERANGGMVVTSSRFTKGAIAFTSEVKYQMHLHDYVNIQKWLGTLGK